MKEALREAGRPRDQVARDISDVLGEDVTPQIRERILAYCRRELATAHYPAARFYPDLAVKAGA